MTQLNPGDVLLLLLLVWLGGMGAEKAEIGGGGVLTPPPEGK